MARTQPFFDCKKVPHLLLIQQMRHFFRLAGDAPFTGLMHGAGPLATGPGS
ncbi:hypothetical protein D3C76_388710 [compost metagenome]